MNKVAIQSSITLMALSTFGQNLLTNGDCETGNAAFSSNYCHSLSNKKSGPAP